MWPLSFFTAPALLAVTVILYITPVSSVDFKDCAKLQDKDKTVLIKSFGWKEPTITQSGTTITLKCDTGFVQSAFPGTDTTFKSCNLVGKEYKFDNKYTYTQVLCRSDYQKNIMVREIQPDQLGSSVLHCKTTGLKVYEVSRKLATGKENVLYRVCLDTKTWRPKFSMKPTADKGKDSGSSPRGTWGFDSYGSSVTEQIDLSKGYEQSYQKGEISDQIPQRYNRISKPFPYYLNRGHLTAFREFRDPENKKGTFEYINAAPQWDKLNDGSWNQVEILVETNTEKNPDKWQIYTGTFDTIPIPNGKLFLVPDNLKGGSSGRSPVPKVFWKLALNTNDPNKQNSKAYVGINNPEITDKSQITADYILCPGPKTVIEGDVKNGFYYLCSGKSVYDKFLPKLKEVEKIVL